MKKVLTYENRKIDDIVWDVSTLKLEEKAKRELFKILDKDWQVFIGIEKYMPKTIEKVCPTCKHKTSKTVNGEKTFEYEQYLQAKKGDYFAIQEILNSVKDDEYCYWHIDEVR